MFRLLWKVPPGDLRTNTPEAAGTAQSQGGTTVQQAPLSLSLSASAILHHHGRSEMGSCSRQLNAWIYSWRLVCLSCQLCSLEHTLLGVQLQAARAVLFLRGQRHAGVILPPHDPTCFMQLTMGKAGPPCDEEDQPDCHLPLSGSQSHPSLCGRVSPNIPHSPPPSPPTTLEDRHTILSGSLDHTPNLLRLPRFLMYDDATLRR